MSAFFKAKNSALCGIIIDIGSGSVAASIVVSDHRKKLPEILYTYREFGPIKSTDTRPEAVQSMRRVLFSVMLTLEQRGMTILHAYAKHAAIQRILISCTAPWSHTVTQMIHFAPDAPFIVTPQLIDDIVLHARDTEETHTPDHAKKVREEGQHIIKKSVIDITLNGYPVHNPYNRKEVSEMTLAHVRELVPTSIVEILEDVKKQIGSGVDMRIRTSMLMLYCVLRDLYPKIKDSLIIDVSGEATEIALVQNGILYESIAAGYGMHSLIRDIARLGKTIPEEARGYLRTYKQKNLTDVQNKILSGAQKNYAHSLEEAFHELTLRYVLPQTMFLILDQDMEQFFTDTIESLLPSRDEYPAKKIVPLSPHRTHDLVTVGKGVMVDPRLALTARFFHKLHACGEIDN